jgi:hypothetical protein
VGNRSSAGRVPPGALAFSSGLSFSFIQVFRAGNTGQNVPAKPFRPRFGRNDPSTEILPKRISPLSLLFIPPFMVLPIQNLPVDFCAR